MDQSLTQRRTELTELVDLLFSTEKEKIEQVSHVLSKLESRVGNDEALLHSLKAVLPDAINEVRENNPRGLRRALTPLVMTSMKTEIKNSQEDFVGMMTPIMGRMMTSMVKSSIQKLSDSINTQIEIKYSPKGVAANLRAKFTGRPVSDFILAKSFYAKVERALITEKSSGKVVTTWTSLVDEDGGEADDENLDLLAGMLTAISNLSEELFDVQAGGLKTIELDGHSLALRKFGRYLIVIEVSGIPSTSEQKLLDGALTLSERYLEAQRESEAIRVFQKINGLLEQGRNGGKFPRAKEYSVWKEFFLIILSIFLISGLVYLVYSGWMNHAFNRDIEVVKSEIRSDITYSEFPLRVERDELNDEILITGLVPVIADIQVLNDRILQKLPNRQTRWKVKYVQMASPPKQVAQ